MLMTGLKEHVLGMLRYGVLLAIKLAQDIWPEYVHMLKPVYLPTPLAMSNLKPPTYDA